MWMASHISKLFECSACHQRKQQKSPALFHQFSTSKDAKAAENPTSATLHKTLMMKTNET